VVPEIVVNILYVFIRYEAFRIYFIYYFVNQSKMSEEQASNSVYGIDSIPDIPESSESIRVVDKETSTLYSSGSSIELSGIQSEAEASNSVIEDTNTISAKTESIRSLWSTTDISSVENNVISTSNQDNSTNCLLPSDASPLIFDGQVIRYNIERGVDYKTPIIFGSRKSKGIEGKDGYRPSHFIFNPKSGTLAAGYDIDNEWSKLPNFSLITGIGNSAELDASFISGSHNKIKLELLHTSDITPSKDVYCLIPPSCAIVGGSNNTITNTAACHYSSAIIASSGIQVQNCQETVILGMRGVSGDKAIEGMQEATVTRNFYSLGRIHAGPYVNDSLPPMTVLVANGDALVNNNLKIGNNLSSNSMTSSQFFTDTASIRSAKISDLEVTNMAQNELYLEGTGVSGTSGTVGLTATFVIYPSDNYNVIYVNPIKYPINIYLGTGTNNVFQSNRVITFKDVTLEFGPTSSNNVNILVPGPNGETGMVPVRIEYYNNGLTAGTNAGYTLNTSGGSVTFRYFSSSTPGLAPTWVIENQFMGNQRVMPSAGLTFIPASDKTRAKLFNHK
jgi:hypothetical protein